MKLNPRISGQLLIVSIIAVSFCIVPISGNAKDTVNPTKENPLILKYASYVGKELSMAQGDDWYFNELEKRTGGKVKVERHWSQSLVKVKESVQALQLGVTDIAFFAPAYFRKEDMFPLTSSTELIYVTDNPDVAVKACSELYKTYGPFREEWESQGLRLLHVHCMSQAILASKKKITTLDDAKGLKVRGLGAISNALELLGMEPFSLSSIKLYDALETGTIDGACATPFDWYIGGNLYKVAPHVTNPGMGIYAHTLTAINLDLWKKLPPDIISVFEELEKEFPKKSTEILVANNLRMVKRGIRDGANINILSARELKRWRDRTVPFVWENWLNANQKPGLPLRECMEEFQELVRKYEPHSKFVGPFQQYENLVRGKN